MISRILVGLAVVLALTIPMSATPVTINLSDGTNVDGGLPADGTTNTFTALGGAITFTASGGNFYFDTAASIFGAGVGADERIDDNGPDTVTITAGPGWNLIDFTVQGLGTNGAVTETFYFNLNGGGVVGPISGGTGTNVELTQGFGQPNPFTSLLLSVGNDSNITLFSVTVEQVPEPATFGLIGVGLLGIGILSRRFRRA